MNLGGGGVVAATEGRMKQEKKHLLNTEAWGIHIYRHLFSVYSAELKGMEYRI